MKGDKIRQIVTVQSYRPDFIFLIFFFACFLSSMCRAVAVVLVLQHNPLAWIVVVVLEMWMLVCYCLSQMSLYSFGWNKSMTQNVLVLKQQRGTPETGRGQAHWPYLRDRRPYSIAPRSVSPHREDQCRARSRPAHVPMQRWATSTGYHNLTDQS